MTQMSYRLPEPGPGDALIQHREPTARRGASRARTGECPVCLGEHEEDIHTATIRVRRWFRSEVTRSFARQSVC
jgi:hypothetical protein